MLTSMNVLKIMEEDHVTTFAPMEWVYSTVLVEKVSHWLRMVSRAKTTMNVLLIMVTALKNVLICLEITAVSVMMDTEKYCPTTALISVRFYDYSSPGQNLFQKFN